MIGEVKTTFGQIKKHYTDFTAKEKVKLNRAIEKLKDSPVYFSKHSRNHIKNLSARMVREVYDKHDIIEFNYKNDDCRILLRGTGNTKLNNSGVEEEACLCIVVSIKSGIVITAYANNENDSHKTLDKRRYISYVNIEGVIN